MEDICDPSFKTRLQVTGSNVPRTPEEWVPKVHQAWDEAGKVSPTGQHIGQVDIGSTLAAVAKMIKSRNKSACPLDHIVYELATITYGPTHLQGRQLCPVCMYDFDHHENSTMCASAACRSIIIVMHNPPAIKQGGSFAPTTLEI